MGANFIDIPTHKNFRFYLVYINFAETYDSRQIKLANVGFKKVTSALSLSLSPQFVRLKFGGKFLVVFPRVIDRYNVFTELLVVLNPQKTLWLAYQGLKLST